ncbi:hypothetical protein ZWY2020_020558 [Hordeum vulgare]|nr:hypothetical protein ZWY2020_020558 [Hordeum vulgare]
MSSRPAVDPSHPRRRSRHHFSAMQTTRHKNNCCRQSLEQHRRPCEAPPTGAVLAFNSSPTFTADGTCTAANRALTACLTGACAPSCFLLCFTDSYRDETGTVRYGFVTPSGRLRLIDGARQMPPQDERYRQREGRAARAAIVRGVLAVAMVDSNVVACFYPVESATTRQLLAAVPMSAGAAGSFLFATFPSTRRGIGFPVAGTS